MVEIAERSCLRAAGLLDRDLRKTIERVKERDFTGTVAGLMVVAQDKGALDACGLELEHAALINAMQAVCPRNWDVIESQLRAFGAEAYKKLYPEYES